MEEEFDKKAELEETEQAESIDTYTHVFNRPFMYDGREIKQLAFDFTKLSGKDVIAISRELASIGRVSVLPKSINDDYLMRFAARSCTEKVGIDVFELMDAKACIRILARVQSFFLATE